MKASLVFVAPLLAMFAAPLSPARAETEAQWNAKVAKARAKLDKMADKDAKAGKPVQPVDGAPQISKAQLQRRYMMERAQARKIARHTQQASYSMTHPWVVQSMIETNAFYHGWGR